MEVTRLFFREGKSDKVYVATLDGDRCKIEWGRRGATLQCKAPADGVTVMGRYQARRLYENKIQEKRLKGYLDETGNPALTPPAVPPYTIGGRVTPMCSGGNEIFRNGMCRLQSCRCHYDLSIPPTQSGADIRYGQPEPTTIPGGRRVLPNLTLAKPLSSYKPMLLNAITPEQAERLISDDNWFMQQKADGIRTLALVDKTVETSSRTGKPVNLTDEIKTALLTVFNVRSVVDSESCGDTLVIFDILHNGAGDMREWSLEKRVDHLEAVAAKAKQLDVPCLSFIQTARTTAQKRAALAALRTGGSEGVCFKRRTAKYSPGETDDAVKWKFKASASVLAIAPHKDGKRSVSIAVVGAGGNLVPVGSVSVPDKWGELPIGRILEIEYLYAFRGGSIFQPALKEIRVDKDAADNIESLQYRGETRA